MPRTPLQAWRNIGREIEEEERGAKSGVPNTGIGIVDLIKAKEKKDIMIYMQVPHLSIDKTIIFSEGLPIAIYCPSGSS